MTREETIRRRKAIADFVGHGGTVAAAMRRFGVSHSTVYYVMAEHAARIEAAHTVVLSVLDKENIIQVKIPKMTQAGFDCLLNQLEVFKNTIVRAVRSKSPSAERAIP